MQKRRLIPTQLVPGPRPTVGIREPYRPGPFHLLKVVRFALALFWFWFQFQLGRLLRRKSRATERARKIRFFLEGMGGMWIKAGQIVAMRRDVFSREICDELSQLQDHALGFPWKYARRVLEEELGPLADTFSEFAETPFAAASIGQTYDARLRASDQRVAVKVQRPFIAESFARDLKYIRAMAWLLLKLRVAPHARLDDMMWEIEGTLNDELDYRTEATSIARMRKTLRGHKIYVPKVYLNTCTRRVIVMEFVTGVFMSDFIQIANTDPERLQHWLEENNIDPAKVGEQLLISRNRQLFEDNLYHSDMHPGNILLQRDSRIVLIDFGSVGTLETSLLEKYALLNAALTNGNFNKMADLWILCCPPLPNRDTDRIKAQLVRVMRTWESRTKIKRLAYHEKSYSRLTMMISGLMRDHQIPVNWEFLRLNRADLTLDASLVFLFPQINYVKVLRKYQEQARARRMCPSPQEVAHRAQGLASLLELPAMLAENLYFDGEWMRQRAIRYEGKLGNLASIAEALLRLTILAAMAAAAYFSWKWLSARYELPGGRDPVSLLPDWVPKAAIVLGALYVFRKLFQIRKAVATKSFER